MQVYLIGKGFLSRFITGKEIDMAPGTRLDQLPYILNIPEQYQLIFIVNDKVRKVDYEISDGDKIIIVSALSGG